MFSIITMASSTTKPVEMVSAISVRLLIENPARYITPKVPTSDSGTATLGITVALALRRNRKITMTTSATASSSSNSVSSTEARMVVVRSAMICTSTEAGSAACSLGSSALTRSTVSMTLAPGWRCTLRMTPGVRSDQAARRRFSASSTICATSLSRSGFPFFQAMMRFWYSAADLSWSLASRVEARCAPSKLPLAWLTLAATMARAHIVERRGPARRVFVDSAWMRTAGRRPPAMLTSPTPSTCESLGASRFSARSCTWITGSDGEVIAMVSTGASAGLTLA